MEFNIDDVDAFQEEQRIVQPLGWKARMLSKIGKMFWENDVVEMYCDIFRMIDENFKDVEASNSKLIMSFLLLQAYYINNRLPTKNLICDNLLFKNAYRFCLFACGAYGWKLNTFEKIQQRSSIFSGLTKAATNFTNNNKGNKSNDQVLIEKTGIAKDDLILSCWDLKHFQPGHYVAIDHETCSIIIGIRGTMSIHDVLTDLSGRNERFYDGHAHRGIVAAARTIYDKVISCVKENKIKYPLYQLVITGHSLGGGCSVILGYILAQEQPEWTIKVWAYAPPPVMDAFLVPSNLQIRSFILGDDFIPRFSIASLQHLKYMTTQIMNNNKNNFQRLYHIIDSGNTLGHSFKEKVEKVISVGNPPDISKIEKHYHDDIKMIHSGDIFHLTEDVTMEYTTQSAFDEIIISNSMFNSHMPSNYEKILSKLARVNKESFDVANNDYDADN